MRQTISKWESGLSVPNADNLIALSKIFETPVSKILGENIAEKDEDENDLKAISAKLEVINEQLSQTQKRKARRLISILAIADLSVILLFALLVALGSPYQAWDYSDPEWSIIGTLWHSFEWIFFKIAPIFIIIITSVLAIVITKSRESQN